MDHLEAISEKMARLAKLSRRERYGERLMRARKEMGLSQQEVAERLGVERKAVSRAETGVESPEELLVALETLYGFVVSYPVAPRDPGRRIEFFDRAWAA